ncbi:type II secretion system minor pseudopilin GspK [Aquabacterium sp.]|uniref:type II secretion system minor pseudopilin GspK n=1 Tax=Aquabacterium sp. TaxID=1872578 RepID=UPI002C9C27AB|nr:type II secretion system minor pseudopilin GspK [Aquabacterium sp.]HSW07118.1 type II secretion system minor pseudopilin GspK [Aquabacterium sp.]
MTRPPARPRLPAPRRRQRGAALLVAMVLLTLVATLAAGMVWQQWRSIEVETAERARVQATWVTYGALNWARLVLREDASTAQRRGKPTGEQGAWNNPLQESRVSTFLAADPNNTADGGGSDLFISGSIQDAQARYNLRNLAEDGKIEPKELELLERLCKYAGVSSDVAGRLADGLLAAQAGTDQNAALTPMRMEDLAWISLDGASIERLRKVATILPRTTKVNLNTAPREVLAAVVEGLDLGMAERLVQLRKTAPFETVPAAQAQLPAGITLPETHLSVSSDFFEVHGRMRFEDRVLEEDTLVLRQNLEVFAVRRQRAQSVLPQTP